MSRRVGERFCATIALWLAVVAGAHAASVTIDFDEVNASRGIVGAPVEAYLSKYGVSVIAQSAVNHKPVVTIESGGPGRGFAASSSPNVFVFNRDGANSPISFTFRFAHPLRSVAFTRAKLIPGRTAFTHPTWHATASDAKGNAVGTPVGEAEIESSGAVPSRRFTITAPPSDRITALTVSADDRASVLIDDLTLTW